MDYRIRAKKVKYITDKKTRERLSSMSYSNDIIQAFDLVNTSNSTSENISLGIVLMDIAWQITGYKPSENELASAFFPIYCFFLGTVYQDDLLDSLSMDKPRALVGTLGVPTCLIMGNILYCEGIISLMELSKDREGKIFQQFIDSIERLVRKIMESEIYRRKHIGKILPSEEFIRVWRCLTPNNTCIEIGGIMGDSEQKKIQILGQIGTNISLANRIVKEISEMYGLTGSLPEKLRNKPPPFPVTLAFESANTFEKKELKEAIKRLAMRDIDKTQITDLQILIDLVAKYNSISAALKIHDNIIEETRGLITQISIAEHKDVLNQLLGSEFLSKQISPQDQQGTIT